MMVEGQSLLGLSWVQGCWKPPIHTPQALHIQPLASGSASASRPMSDPGHVLLLGNPELLSWVLLKKTHGKLIRAIWCLGCLVRDLIDPLCQQKGNTHHFCNERDCFHG